MKEHHKEHHKHPHKEHHHGHEGHMKHAGHHSEHAGHGHVKHGHHPHDHHAAMPQFNEGHWEKKMHDVSVADGKYSSEMNQAEEYKHSTDKLAAYAKHHRAQH